jgi:DNA-binding GntR family transcriptional regulator
MPRPSRNAVSACLPPFEIDRSIPAPEQVYRALRDSIVSLRIEPGSPLSEGEAASACAVSRTPVREAFSRLVDDQLLDVFPNLGTFVSLIDPHLVTEASLMRRLLEGEAAARAAAKRPAALIAEMQAALADHAAAVAVDDAERAYACDERFHCALFLCQRLGQMWTSVSRARTQLDRVHHLMASQKGALSDALAKHRAILAAIDSGEPETARRAMTVHIDANAAFLDGLVDRNHPFVRPL